MKGNNLVKLTGFALLCWSWTGWAEPQSHYRHHIASTPKWVVKVAQSAPKGESDDAGKHYMLSDNQVRLNGDNQQSYSHFKFRYDDYSSIESSSDIRIRFDPAYQVPTFHAVDIIRNGKRVSQLSEDKLKFYTSEDEKDSNIYGGDVEAVLLLEDVRIGDVVEYSYTIEGSNPVFDNHFSSFFALGYGVPVDNLFVRVEADKSIGLHYKVGNIADSFKVTEKNGRVDYRMLVTYAPATHYESDVPSWYDPYPWVHFSQYDSWQDVADWAYKLFDVKGKLSPKLQAFVNSIKSSDKREMISRAAQFVQDDVRYLGLELGENSHRPHHPNETFANRYGDCKDKSLLLATILNAVGIDAWPALVSTAHQGHLDQYLPADNLFNHAIVTVSLDGESIWIDPTISYQGSKLAHIYQPTYGKALIIRPGTRSLEVAKPTHSEPATVEVDEEIQAADYSSPVIKTITTRYRGRQAENQRYRLSSRSLSALSRQFLNYYAKTYPKIRSLEKIKVEDDRANNQLVITEKYLVPGYWEKDGTGANFELYTDLVSQYMELPKTIVRDYPLAMYRLDQARHKVTMNLPEDISFRDEVGTEVIEDPYFKFLSTIDYDRRRISYITELNIKQDSVKAEDTAEHIVKLKKARNMLGYSNGITNVDSSVGKQQVARLLQALSSKISENQR